MVVQGMSRYTKFMIICPLQRGAEEEELCNQAPLLFSAQYTRRLSCLLHSWDRIYTNRTPADVRPRTQD